MSSITVSSATTSSRSSATSALSTSSSTISGASETSSTSTGVHTALPSFIDNAPGKTAAENPVLATGTAPAGDGGNREHANQDQDDKSRVINYYFAFLALIVIFMFIGAFFFTKRQRRIKAHRRQFGHDALAQDLNGWVNTRRWIHGSWRTDSMTRREEGLNEHGEAPPPYEPTPSGTSDAAPGSSQPGALANRADPELAIPLRTLQRDDVGLKPPDYHETISSDVDGTSTRRSTAAPPHRHSQTSLLTGSGVGADESRPSR